MCPGLVPNIENLACLIVHDVQKLRRAHPSCLEELACREPVSDVAKSVGLLVLSTGGNSSWPGLRSIVPLSMRPELEVGVDFAASIPLRPSCC